MILDQKASVHIEGPEIAEVMAYDFRRNQDEVKVQSTAPQHGSSYNATILLGRVAVKKAGRVGKKDQRVTR